MIVMRKSRGKKNGSECCEWKNGMVHENEDRVYSNQRRKITQAARPPNTARTVRMRMAHRHRFAHLSSTLRNVAMSSLRSSSVFSGIHAGAESVVLVGGSRKGDMRIKAPNIQNGGNTIID